VKLFDDFSQGRTLCEHYPLMVNGMFSVLLRSLCLTFSDYAQKCWLTLTGFFPVLQMLSDLGSRDTSISLGAVRSMIALFNFLTHVFIEKIQVLVTPITNSYLNFYRICHECAGGPLVISEFNDKHKTRIAKSTCMFLSTFVRLHFVALV
jgi:hypothetical protein